MLTQAYKEVEKVIRDFPSPIKTRLNKPEVTSTLFFCVRRKTAAINDVVKN